jgi:hypothetical protein
VQFEIEFGDRASVADLEITFSGVATPSAFRQLADTLARDPRFRAGLTMLVDLSALDTSALGDDDLQGITEPVAERDWYHPPAAVAIIAPNEKTLADARAYRAHLGGSRSRRQVFKTRTEAVTWLEERHSEAPDT